MTVPALIACTVQASMRLPSAMTADLSPVAKTARLPAELTKVPVRRGRLVGKGAGVASGTGIVGRRS